jgi:hypothetical protein
MSGRLRARAMMLIKRADEGGGGYRELIERELSARLVSRARSGAKEEPHIAERTAQPHDAEVLPDTAPADLSVVRPDDDGRICADCGTGNDVDASFCKRCGTRLEAVTA